MPTKNLKMELSKDNIKKTLKKLQEVKKAINNADEEIVKQLSEFGLQEIENNYNSTGYKDGNDDIGFFITGTAKKKKIGVTGSQVLYNEFGTGTEGQQSPHPEKDNFGLNGYNTGKTIRKNNNINSNASQLQIPEGGLYWTYNNGGIKVYTQGIPAGKQVYNAKKALEEQKEKISKKVLGDALSKL